MIDIEKLKEILNSEEGLANAKAFFQKFEDEDAILESQIKRFHEKFSFRFDEIVNKIILKYSTNEYYNRYMMRGLLPSEDLYFFLYEYVTKYGNRVEDESNPFSDCYYLLGDYKFQKMYAQGTVVLIDKI
jgi:hypothetical protein